jgi:hypothetical protein
MCTKDEQLVCSSANPSSFFAVTKTDMEEVSGPYGSTNRLVRRDGIYKYPMA